jgi:hypothetical protein
MSAARARPAAIVPTAVTVAIAATVRTARHAGSGMT